MTQLFANNASSLLDSDVTFSGVTLQLLEGTGADFPLVSAPDYFLATLHNADYSEWEIVRVTARSSDTLTVSRGYEGPQQAWSAGTIVSANLTKDTMEEIYANIDDLTQSVYDTGGSGSAGAGNQYVLVKIGGVTYKLLHDGTV